MLRKATQGHTVRTGFHGDDTALPARAGELIDLREDQGKEERSRQFNDSILE